MRTTRVADGQRRRLIALDGVQTSDVAAATEALVETLSARHVTVGVSRFDASGLFGDLAAAAPETRIVSPRILVLMYAADLAFRLRWEIAPALESGSTFEGTDELVVRGFHLARDILSPYVV